MLRDAKIEGLVIWGEAEEAGLILKQMRQMGMNQPVFGGSRLAYPRLLEIAGPAAEGLVVTSALDPTRKDPKWVAFRDAYRQKFHEEPIDYAASAFDGMNILIAAIEKDRPQSRAHHGCAARLPDEDLPGRGRHGLL